MRPHWYHTAWRRNVVDTHILDWDQRFLAKSRGLAIEMENQGPEQALHAGLMECMECME